MEEIISPGKSKARIGRLLRNNRDAVANPDKEFGQTHTVKIRIDTDDQTKTV